MAKLGYANDLSEQDMWNYFRGEGLTAYGAAGLMGNLYCESSLNSNNLQNTGNTKLGMTDAEYTAAVDNGTYTNFVKDSLGYGIAQWTYYTRKQGLKDYSDLTGYSIGSRKMQAMFLMNELKADYASVLKTLKSATTIAEASNAVLKNYEKPANTGATVQAKRIAASQTYYDKYAG